MELVRFKNEEPKTIFAPVYDYIIGEDFLTRAPQYWSMVKDVILKKEKEILNSTSTFDDIISDGYTGLGNNSLTSRHKKFNVFKWQEPTLDIILKGIKSKYLEYLKLVNAPRRKVLLKCWANVMRKGEQIKPHLHDIGPYSYLGGHISVTNNNTSTFYINTINQINEPSVYESKNEPGKITIFPHVVPHYTSVNNSDSERITIAFDFIVDEMKKIHGDNLITLDEGI